MAGNKREITREINRMQQMIGISSLLDDQSKWSGDAFIV